MSAKEAHQRLTFPSMLCPMSFWLKFCDMLPGCLMTSRLRILSRSGSKVHQQENNKETICNLWQVSFDPASSPLLKLYQVTKRYVVRVCKKWYRLAYMFLYEWVFVGKLKNLRGLILSIEQLASNELANRTLIGWYTKRLDINIRWAGGEIHDHNIGQLLLRLVRNLDSLEVFVVKDFLFFADVCLCLSVSHTWCPKLRIFNYIYDDPILDQEVWVAFLRSHPHVIGLKTSLTDRPNKPFASFGFSHSLLSYSTYNISPIPTTLFISLQRLGISFYEPRSIDLDWQDHLITEPLPSLTVLQLNFPHGVNEKFSSAARRLIYQFMPNLQRVNLVLSAWPDIWLEITFPETVRVLGVRICSTKPSKRLAKFLLQKLAETVHYHGSRDPLVIHFLDRGTSDRILVHREHLIRHAQEEGDILKRWIDCDGCEYQLVL